MGICSSYINGDLSPASRSFHAIKREKKLLLLGLTPEFEEEIIQKLQSTPYTKQLNQNEDSIITSQYSFGALTIKESAPNNLPWNTMDGVDKHTFSKLLKHWNILDYDVFLQGWFRQNYNDSFPNDIVKYMKIFCCVPSVTVSSYKMKGNTNHPNHLFVYNLLNVSSIYRKCWSLSNNKECFRHKELSYCFKHSKATLFVVDLSIFNETDDRSDANKMNRTIKLYQWFLKDYSLYLKKNRVKQGKVVLLFERVEPFKDKLAHNIAISQCSSFAKYNGSNEYEPCKEFIEYRFRAMNLYSNVKVNVHFGMEDKATFLNQLPC
eukprot:203278_1